MSFDFTDKIVVVGGATGNLGQAVTRAFRAAGATLALVDYSADRLPALYPDLAADSRHLFCQHCDVTNSDSVAVAMAQIQEKYDRVDIFANTIGGYRAGTPLTETPDSTWDSMVNLNARSIFLTSRAILPGMIEHGSGKVIHVLARAALHGSAKAAAYTASKAAALRLVESMSEEVKQYGINVNCVLPGTIDTPQNRNAMPEADHNAWVLPEAIADVFLFLASDAARAIHGAAIPVYGLS
ncbi:MAG: SDR family NAD(P)-dependent oxidoreductase [Caldilineales bacterium]|nr:SDR family NAD(P)-dependent oxidoreductase [Caldilineales bacterium]